MIDQHMASPPAIWHAPIEYSGIDSGPERSEFHPIVYSAPVMFVTGRIIDGRCRNLHRETSLCHSYAVPRDPRRVIQDYGSRRSIDDSDFTI